MKDNCYIRHIRDERVLMLFSYLQVLPENSRFSDRLMACTTQAIIDLKHRHGLKWSILDDILGNGSSFEDPQEQLFTHQVGSPLGSFTVFPGPFQFYQYNLTRLLNLAGLLKFENKNLGVVYFLLSLSQTIAEKTNAQRYSIGMPDNDSVFIPNRQELEQNIDCICFSKSDLTSIAQRYDLSWIDIEKLIFKAKRKELRVENSINGYCEAITLMPLYKHREKYILLSPSALLHSAYCICKQQLIEHFGLESLTKEFSRLLLDETALLLRNIPEQFLGKVSLEGANFLLYKEDGENVFCVFPYLYEERQNIEKCLNVLDSYVKKYIHANGVSMFVVVYSQIEDCNFGLSFPKNSLAFSIDDFSVIINQHNINLNTLYYFLQDKKTINSTPFSQEIDSFAYYLGRRQTFYLEEKPDYLDVPIGMALWLREKYYKESDIRYVESAMFKSIIPVEHFHDIPDNVPAYAPHYAPTDILFFMIEIGGYRLTIKYDNKSYGIYEIVHSISLWLYAAWKVKRIPVLSKHVDIIFKDSECDSICQMNNNVFIVKLNTAKLFQSNCNNIEELILLKFVKLLHSQDLLSPEITEPMIHEMFEDSCGHFMITDMKSNNPLLICDGVTECHYLSDRWADKILDEIADFLDCKGEEKQLSFEESKRVMIKVMDYLKNEAKQILSSINTARMLKSCLSLHHAMIYWSRLTNYRYDVLSQAYKYIGAELKNQTEYLNDYTEMNILAQGLLELIIESDLHSEGDVFCINTFDRLFAIIHHIANFGIYFDLLNDEQSDFEIIILKNGRLEFSQLVEEINNKYFSTLRERSMKDIDVMISQRQLLPKYEVDRTDENFKVSFVEEFGIDIDLLFDIQGKSIDYANQNGQQVMVMSKQLFDEKILSGILTGEQLNVFYKNFVLSKEAFAGIPTSQKLLQRYNRSVQLSSRPWVLYDGNIFYSTKSIYVSCQVLLDRLDAGTIRHISSLMNTYIGKISKEKGHLFTQNLCSYFKSLKDENIKVYMEVPICPGKPLAAEKNLGDIDVLLIDSKRKKIVCIEAKDYYEARNIYDMISQKGKIAKALPKVIQRDAWVKENKELFKYYFDGIDDTYEVKTIFLTYEEPTYKYFKHLQEISITLLSAFDVIKDYNVIFQ